MDPRQAAAAEGRDGLQRPYRRAHHDALGEQGGLE